MRLKHLDQMEVRLALKIAALDHGGRISTSVLREAAGKGTLRDSDWLPGSRVGRSAGPGRL